MILSPNDSSSPTPTTPAHVLMEIIHQLSVPIFYGLLSFLLYTESTRSKEEISSTIMKITMSLCRHKSFWTPDLQPKFRFHQIDANGSWRSEFGFKTTGGNVMFKEESVSAAWKQLPTCPVGITGRVLNWLHLYQPRNFQRYWVSWEGLQRQPLTLSTLTLTFLINRRASSSHCSLYLCLSSSPATAAS